MIYYQVRDEDERVVAIFAFRVDADECARKWGLKVEEVSMTNSNQESPE